MQITGAVHVMPKWLTIHFPYYIIELSSGKQTSVYEDEIIEKV